MNVFLLDRPETNEDVERLLESRPKFVRMPDGKRRMTWLPRVVWQAEDFAIVSGYKEEQLIQWAVEQGERTGFPLEITYPFVVYSAAHRAAQMP